MKKINLSILALSEIKDNEDVYFKNISHYSFKKIIFSLENNVNNFQKINEMAKNKKILILIKNDKK